MEPRLIWPSSMSGGSMGGMSSRAFEEGRFSEQIWIITQERTLHKYRSELEK